MITLGKLLQLIFFLLIGYFFQATNAFALPLANAKFISYSDGGQGEPLVLIHPFLTDKDLWLPQQGLKHHFRVITLDLWGFGRSERTSGYAIPMTEYADEVAQLLDQLDIKKAIIGGESMGGYIALAFLKKYPERTKGLILANTQAVADDSESKKSYESKAMQVLVQGTEQLINNFMTQALSFEAHEQAHLFLQNILIMQSPTAVASALRGMVLREDNENILAETTLPVLIITSDQDQITLPQQSANMHALAKNSQLVVIENAGHLANIEQPEQWNKAVVAMFKNIG